MPERTEDELLLEFERKYIPPHYKPYYLPKRHNFLATIQQFPYLWNCFMHLDEIVVREFDAMQRLRDIYMMLPMVLFMNAHQKMRVAFELGCSTCLSEAHSILRDSIESAAHGNRLASDPQLLKAWMEKNDSEAAKRVFSAEFEQDKTNRLFDGLPDLHKLWRQFSEFGSHTNINSIVTRFEIRQDSGDLQYRLNYIGGDPTIFVPALFEMVLAFSLIERVIYNLAQNRLQFDAALTSLRTAFEVEKETTRRHIIKTFNLRPPSTP